MKILLISDTHGDITKVVEILEHVQDVDLVLHCGDYQGDAEFLTDCVQIPAIAVSGNCDHDNKYRKAVETPAGKLLITHGHMEMVDFSDKRLLDIAEEEGDCIAVCFGHTHVPRCEEIDGLWLINPGSLTEPRNGSRPSCAILQCEEDGFYPSLADYDTLVPPQEKPAPPDPAVTKKKKATGGFLRKLLNYSDRF